MTPSRFHLIGSIKIWG